MTDEPLRRSFVHGLEDLRIQVELMAVKVDRALEWMRAVVEDGDLVAAAQVVAADDDIDASNVDLMERCHELLMREQPVAGDLRLIVAALRVTAELERVGDLAIRASKAAEARELIASEPVVHDLLVSMANRAIAEYRLAGRAWAAVDLGLATELAGTDLEMSHLLDRLVTELVALRRPDAPELALRAITLGRALDRIADHARVIGARVRYLVTGDAMHLAAEVR
jgi:phosphate transport system protein